MAYHPSSSIQKHGAIFDVIIAEAQRVFGQQWHTRAVINGLAAFVGVVAIALCGLELGGWWAALLAALSLWLYPRFFGAMFNNSRDIPFTSVTILILWAVLIFVRQWEMRRIYHAYNLPRYYSPGWLVVGSPPAVVIFAAIGGLFACITLIKSKFMDTKIVLICLALMLPLGALVYLRSTLYDGMRQFLFLVPPLILLGVYG